jgi:hypothetical protein
MANDRTRKQATRRQTRAPATLSRRSTRRVQRPGTVLAAARHRPPAPPRGATVYSSETGRTYHLERRRAPCRPRCASRSATR